MESIVFKSAFKSTNACNEIDLEENNEFSSDMNNLSFREAAHEIASLLLAEFNRHAQHGKTLKPQDLTKIIYLVIERTIANSHLERALTRCETQIDDYCYLIIRAFDQCSSKEYNIKAVQVEKLRRAVVKDWLKIQYLNSAHTFDLWPRAKLAFASWWQQARTRVQYVILKTLAPPDFLPAQKDKVE